MTSIDDIERKLRQAEDKAWKVIDDLGLPRRLDGHGPSLANFEEHEQFRTASDKDKRRVVHARNVLISARKVRECLDRGDAAGAVNYARYLEQDPDLLEDARRGAKVRRSASEGGKTTAAANRPDQQARWDEWRREARDIWSRRPDLSASDVARQIEKKDSRCKADTIRRKISDLNPSKK